MNLGTKGSSMHLSSSCTVNNKLATYRCLPMRCMRMSVEEEPEKGSPMLEKEELLEENLLFMSDTDLAPARTDCTPIL